MLRDLLKTASLAATVVVLTPLAAAGYLQRLWPLRPRDTPGSRRAVVVTPFRPGEESGGARAVLELEQDLRSRGTLLTVLSLRDAHLPWGLRGVISRWLSRPLPLPPTCREILLGGPALSASLASADVVVFEFFATALAVFLRRPLATRTVLRDHEVLLRKLAIDYRGSGGVDALQVALRWAACYLVSLVVYAKVHRIVALTQEDAQSIRAHFPWLAANVTTIPVSFRMPVRPTREAGTPQVRDLVMVGNFFHTPNVDALRWFLADCAPHLGAGFVLHVFGIDGPLDALDLSHTSIRVVRHGFVDALETALPTSAIAVSPVVSGGGVRMKNLLLASLALPVVTTPLGNEGIGFTDGVDAIVTADGREMAARIAALASAGAAQMGDRGRTFVEAQFGAQEAGNRLMAEVFPEWAPTTAP